jgi:hypothetical protein
VQVFRRGLSSVNAGGCGVNRTMREGEGSVAHPGSDLHAQRPDDGIVGIAVDAIFTLMC